MEKVPKLGADGKTPPKLAAQLREAFEQTPFERGRIVEAILGAGDLTSNYPLFDRFRYLGESGFEMTSIKSRDLRASCYRRLSAFVRRARRDIDAVAHFTRIPQWQHAARKLSLIEIRRDDAARLALEVAVRGAERHPGFDAAVRELSDYASTNNVTLRVVRC